jgi:hypothetical protein
VWARLVFEMGLMELRARCRVEVGINVICSHGLALARQPIIAQLSGQKKEELRVKNIVLTILERPEYSKRAALTILICFQN